MHLLQLKNRSSFLALLFILGFSIQGFSQNELDKKFKAIPAKTPKTKEVVPPTQEAPTVNPPAPIEKPDPSKIDPEELFKDSNLYKAEANTTGIFYRKNQFLGSFKTSTFTSTIRYRDAAYVDGDKIKVYLNDKVIEPEVVMNSEYQGFKITLVPGINKIDFEALNEGSASPNTAEFQVYDDKGAVIESSQWNVGTGYKATIVLYKE